MTRRVAALAVAAVILQPAIHAGQAPAEANLAAGVSQIRDGDYLRAIFSLNDAVSQLAGRPESAAMLARVHAYRASAYIELDQPERAMAAALLAFRADPKIVVAPPEFSQAVVRLFTDPAAFAAAKPLASAAKTEIPIRRDPAAKTESVAPAMATIYVYRPGHYVGKLNKPKVLCDGRVIAELQNARYVTVNAAAGAHAVRFGNKQIPLVAEGGRTYYIEVSVAGFGWSARFVNADQGALEIRENKMQLNDPDRTFGTECSAGPVTTTRKR